MDIPTTQDVLIAARIELPLLKAKLARYEKALRDIKTAADYYAYGVDAQKFNLVSEIVREALEEKE